MAKLKEFRIDAFSYPMNSSHLIINGKGDVKTFSGINVKISKIKKLQSFLQALDSALILDFKALGKYKDAENHYQLMLKLKSEIESKSINIFLQVGGDGKLFSHITTKRIADEFAAQTGITIDKRKISLPAEINSVGIFTAIVDLGKNVQATIEMNVLEK